jgi:hypothetical protein
MPISCHLKEKGMECALNPCPLCGGVAELKESHYLETDGPYSYVHCTNKSCKLHHEMAHFSGDSEARNSEEAVAAWNGRTEVPVEQV